MATPQRFRKRPVEVQAMQVLDDLDQLYAVAEWIRRSGGKLTDPLHTFDCAFRIHTLEGDMQVNIGDYVIRGVQGEFYPCKPDIFEATYEAVSESEDDHVEPGDWVIRDAQGKISSCKQDDFGSTYEAESE